jgi:small redox-active disulfide protein 2
MLILVCGKGYPKCQATKESFKKVLKELGLEGESVVVEVKDINAIVNRGVLVTPGVFIDGQKVSEGKVPSVDEIKSWVKERRS